ncbi:MAG: DNA-3-methyladenine glycosylase I [Thermoleophilia bacterium]|nr:DNA-3-methyladenine glycosylase I [Thermoleophilia bacterium]
MFERLPWMQRAGEYPRSDAEYFALLARAVFSGGLGPRVVEARWEGLRFAFRGLDPEKVAVMDESDVARLLADPGVIRNRRKIEAVIANAGIFLQVVAEKGGFHAYLESLGVGEDLHAAAEDLAARFSHLGRTSAALFLFSAGWRERAAREATEAAVKATRAKGTGRGAAARKGSAEPAVTVGDAATEMSGEAAAVASVEAEAGVPAEAAA